MQTALLKVRQFLIASTPLDSGPTELPERKWRRGVAAGPKGSGLLRRGP